MKCKLADICKVNSSKRIYAKEYMSSGIPFYRSKEIIKKSKGNSIIPNKYISRSKFNELKKKYGVPQANDILITSVGTIGTPYIVRKSDLPFYFKDGNLIRLSSWKNTKVNPKFIFYWLESNEGQDAIKRIMIGSTQKALTINSVSSIMITLPSLKLQKKIALTLSSLDSKIILNKKINAEIISLLNLRFKYVLYNNAHANTTTINKLHTKVISGSWGKNKIKRNYYNPSYIIRGKDFHSIQLGGLGDIPLRFIGHNAVKRRLKPNDILIEISGGSPTQSTGRSLFISQNFLNEHNKIILGTNFTKVFRANSYINSVFIFSYLRYLYNAGIFFNYENGTTGIKNLDYKAISKMKLLDFRNTVSFQKYLKLFNQCQDLIQNLGRENKILENLKELLIEKIFKKN